MMRRFVTVFAAGAVAFGLPLAMAAPAQASNNVKVTIDALDWEWKPTVTVKTSDLNGGRQTYTFGGQDSIGNTINAGVIELGSFEVPTLGEANVDLSRAERRWVGGDWQNAVGPEIGKVANPGIGNLKWQSPRPSGSIDVSLTKFDGFYELKFALKDRVPSNAPELTSLTSVAPDECTITGTPGNDVITGTPGNDVICGLGGDDVIHGKGGDDVIKGGRGDDTLLGGDGDDILGGGPGDDILSGGNGDDAMHGAIGDDVLLGGDGNDLADSGSGDGLWLPDGGDGVSASSIDASDKALLGPGGCVTMAELDRMKNVDTRYDPEKDRIIVVQNGLPLCE